LLDPAAGSAHFEVADAIALQIYQQLAAAVPGFLLPKLVHDISGMQAKQVQDLQPVQAL
jgi:L-lysine 2,3-aminomutase